MSKPVSFTYDSDGRRICTIYPNGTLVETEYNEPGQVVSIKAAAVGPTCTTSGTPGGTIFASYVYTYNRNGVDTDLRQTLATNGTAPYTFSYDGLNRLTQSTGWAPYGDAGTFSYAYDWEGNIVSAINPDDTNRLSFYNGADEIATSGTSSRLQSPYSYDGAGNLTSRPDVSGSPRAFDYDALEQTTSVNPDGFGAQAFSYLTDNQTRPSQIGSPAAQGLEPPTVYTNQLGIAAQQTVQPAPISAAIGRRPSVATSVTTDIYYTRDPDGRLLGERTPTGDYYYVADANGSVVALTDSTGAVTNTYSYDPYGRTLASAGSAPNSFGFDGGFEMPGGLYLFGNRYYDPNSGAWTQPDPIPHVDDPTQMDRYTFAADDPVNNTDLSGTESCTSAVHRCTRWSAGLVRRYGCRLYHYLSESYSGGTWGDLALALLGGYCQGAAFIRLYKDCMSCTNACGHRRVPPPSL